MKQKAYETANQFHDDLRWFQNNCRTIHARRRDIQEAAQKLIGYVKYQIEMVQACEECYQNESTHGDNSFVMSCTRPHLLVWARNSRNGCPMFLDNTMHPDAYYPAKVMTTNVKDKTVCVRFFGMANVWRILPASNCFIFSREYPIKKVHVIKVAMNVSFFFFLIYLYSHYV